MKSMKRHIEVHSLDPHKRYVRTTNYHDNLFNAWYHTHTSKSPGIPCKIELPKVHKISVSETYRCIGKLIPYTDEEGVTYPLVNDKEVIPAANRHLRKCEHGGGAFKTFYTDHTSTASQVPDGIHLFNAPEKITQCLAQGALRDAHNLFKNPLHIRNKRIHMLRPNPPPNNYIMFYNRNGISTQPKFLEVMKILYNATPQLAEYIMIYVSVIREILRSTKEEMELLQFTLVHYDKSAGLNPHIDSIHMFQNTIGPIFTVAMGETEKLLDMLPLLLPPTEESPVRLYSQPNDIIVMDGPARVLWAHSLPWQYPHEQFTLVFKFPELQNKVQTLNVNVGEANINIPYYIDSSKYIR